MFEIIMTIIIIIIIIIITITHYIVLPLLSIQQHLTILVARTFQVKNYEIVVEILK